MLLLQEDCDRRTSFVEYGYCAIAHLTPPAAPSPSSDRACRHVSPVRMIACVPRMRLVRDSDARLFSASAHPQGRRRWSFRQAPWRPPAGADPQRVRSGRRPLLPGWALQALVEDARRDLVYSFLFERATTLGRNVDVSDCDCLALHHDRTKV